MMNDIFWLVPGGILCYADDTTLMHYSKSFQNLKVAMAHLIQLIAQWFQANFFSLNNDKTQTIVFTLNKVATEMTSVKLLGITLDVKLTWSQHISNICSKLSRVLFC